jgi:hypothetical protein
MEHLTAMNMGADTPRQGIEEVWMLDRRQFVWSFLASVSAGGAILQAWPGDGIRRPSPDHLPDPVRIAETTGHDHGNRNRFTHTSGEFLVHPRRQSHVLVVPGRGVTGGSGHHVESLDAEGFHPSRQFQGILESQSPFDLLLR